MEAAHAPDVMEEAPEESLAFALSDGRVGVLAVKGRKVRALRPTLAPAVLLTCLPM